MSPDPLRLPLDVASLRTGLTGAGSAWRRIDVVAETGSTNADLLARASAGADVGDVVLVAEHQTAGRGRNGRVWDAAPGAQLLLSVGARAGDVPAESWGWLPLAAGVAVVDAVIAETGIRAGLKWPNDVLCEGRKLAGILAEVAAPEPVIVLGIGLNVSIGRDEVNDPNATSLTDLGVVAPNRDSLLRTLLTQLAERIRAWRQPGMSSQLATDYRAHSLTIGSRVRVALPGSGELVGRAEAIDGNGRLVVCSDGNRTAISAGDVIHLRRAQQ
ncbi:biotin--[acetyl-CoA-carboxylase] ligase [Mycobacterium sp. E740]|uniref:biotin--[acetyl-CoA-carboxylase] ligase n=1 Tax=Mycobacterium sp. E740 TaxID=1834149 RepID=UPI0007FE837D|nr:biotin--[acetyl-CoA-carboxylase] ligase [Mycobacterium sp. E740]OBI72190.1 biotin--[acetyl-CoA-carboxylase] ligase [Mycobacterium sp. E740]